MQKDETNIHNMKQKNWLWSDCKLVLRRTNPNNPSEESYQNLQAQVELQSDEIDQPFIPILQFKESFIYNIHKGFYWKKGLPLPPLVIKLQKDYFQLLKEDEQIIQIYCELTVAYPNRKDTHFYLQQVKTIGQKTKKFSNQGEVKFQGLILKESSHQKSNSKFSLVVSICACSIQQNKIILKTLISTAFYIENSKIIRKKVKKKKFVMKLISPKTFLKPLYTINLKQQTLDKQFLLQYFKTCNKNAQQLTLKHPLYIVYHFSEIFKIYFNSKQVIDLYQFLEKSSLQIDFLKEASSQCQSSKKTIKYELKKTKKIKKQALQGRQNKLKRQKLIIEAHLRNNEWGQNKLLLITFEQKIFKILASIQQCCQGLERDFKKDELKSEIEKLALIFQNWANTSIEVDLFKKQPEWIYWKGLNKQNVFEAYKKHYYATLDRLKGKQVEIERGTIQQQQKIS